ncbi:MAG TPA: hypothetical protein VFQ97_01085 [Gallionella sp.]|nr:hypothetical protein [Gallionella sp.]
MYILSKRNAVILAIALSILMWLTRDHHVATLTHLPDASWAIFFLLGFYFRQRMMLPVFLAQAALADYLAITQFGVDDYCVTAAYPFLIPAYFSLWLAGRWYAARHQFHARSLPRFAAAAVSGTAACEMISSGSFYFLGGRFANTSLTEFASRLAQYFPGNLAGVALYLGIASLIHMLIVSAQHSASPAQ